MRTAVYFNERNELVIRQEADHVDEDVCIAPQNIDEFLDKLTDMAGIPSVGRS